MAENSKLKMKEGFLGYLKIAIDILPGKKRSVIATLELPDGTTETLTIDPYVKDGEVWDLRLKLRDFFQGRKELEKDFLPIDFYLIYNFTLPEWTIDPNDPDPYFEPIIYEQLGLITGTGNGLTNYADGRSIRVYKALPVKVEFNSVTKVIEVEKNKKNPLDDLFEKVSGAFGLEHNIYLLNEKGEYYSPDDEIPSRLLKEAPDVVSIKEYIKVLVRFKDDVIIPFVVYPDKYYTDVGMLKKQICALSNDKIETDNFRTIFNGKKLEDSELLYKYGYKEGGIVNVTLSSKDLSEEKVNKHIESVKVFEAKRKVSPQIISSTSAIDIDQKVHKI